MRRPRTAVAAAAIGISLTLPGAALATWAMQGSGPAAAAATTMPAGNTPSAIASGTDVIVTWPTADLANGTAVAGYVIHRRDAGTGALATVAANCAGTITTTTCTEHNVPTGTWTYTDTPVEQNWIGGESPQSSPVSVS